MKNNADENFIVNKPLHQAYESIVVKYDNPRHLAGWATGFTNLDQHLSGLQHGDLLLITGEPLVGKTVFAANVACNIISSPNNAVIYFTLEMSSARLARRMIISTGRLNCTDLNSGIFTDEVWGILTSSIKTISDKNIYVLDEVRSIAEMIDYARLLNEKQKVGLVVIDSLPLAQEFMDGSIDLPLIGNMTAKLKSLARELNATVMLISNPINVKNKLSSDHYEISALIPHIDIHLNIIKDDSIANDGESFCVTTIEIVRARHAGPGCISLLFSKDSVRLDNLINDNDISQGHYSD